LPIGREQATPSLRISPIGDCGSARRAPFASSSGASDARVRGNWRTECALMSTAGPLRRTQPGISEIVTTRPTNPQPGAAKREGERASAYSVQGRYGEYNLNQQQRPRVPTLQASLTVTAPQVDSTIRDERLSPATNRARGRAINANQAASRGSAIERAIWRGPPADTRGEPPPLPGISRASTARAHRASETQGGNHCLPGISRTSTTRAHGPHTGQPPAWHLQGFNNAGPSSERT
jgi:hypothetical protein